MATIAITIQKSLKHLGHTVAFQDLEKYQTEVVPDLWSDELGRLRVWTANLGAHQTGQSSLDFRLREASHLKDQILRVLGRLQRTIQDLEALLHDTGLHEEYSSDSDDSEEEDQTEIQKIYHALHDTISILFDNAVAIRRSAQHDRLLGVKRSDTAGFELWDRKHVADKFPGLDPAIRDRLGLAISQRRATLKYRERHHLKLAQGLDSVEDTGLSETVATELVVKPAEDNFELQSTTSQTSYAKTIMNGQEGMVVPPPPKGSLNGNPFECPCCFLLIKINNRHSWTQHVFHDLMPYVCVFPNCRIPHRLFESRREWYAHLQNEHSVPDEAGSSISCPLCSMSVGSAKPFQRHLGRHLQELALFALPRSSLDEDNESDTSTKPEQLEEDIQHIMSDDLDESVLDDFDELDTSAKPEINKISHSSHSSHSYDAQETVDREHVFSGEKYGTFKCEWSDCSHDRMFSSKEVLMRHIKTQHINPRSFTCPLCDHATNRQDDMRAHKLAIHNDASEQPQMVDADLTRIFKNNEEKPYPRKGKTRVPRHLAHIHAIMDLGYPFKEEDDVIVIQKALSKPQIDEVISLSREFKRPSPTETEYIGLSPSPPLRERPRERVTTEYLQLEEHSPRSGGALIVEASPSRHRSRSRMSDASTGVGSTREGAWK